jgi:DNA-binding NtrC family response regulator
VVDDEESIRDLLKLVLTGEGYSVVTANDGEEAIEYLDAQQFALVITDLVMPKVNGVEVLRAARRIDPNYPVIVITGYPSAEAVTELESLGVGDYLTKPFNIDVVIATVAKLLEMGRMSGEPGSGDSE